MDDEKKPLCPICLQFLPYKNPYVLKKCGHTICFECIQKLEKRLCPHCRKPFELPEDIVPNYVLLDLFEAKLDREFINSYLDGNSLHIEGLNLENIDPVKALIYFRLAASKNNMASLVKIGMFYEKGLGGLEQDLQKAFTYYLETAENGYYLAYFDTARCYENGIGTEKNEYLAFYYYRLGAQEIEHDMSNLLRYHTARCYENGIGVKKNERQAFRYYRMGAKKNEYDLSELLQYHAARCCENGIGTVQDISRALKYYNLSARNGFEKSKRRLQYFSKIIAKIQWV